MVSNPSDPPRPRSSSSGWAFSFAFVAACAAESAAPPAALPGATPTAGALAPVTPSAPTATPANIAGAAAPSGPALTESPALAPAPADFRELVSGEWELQPGLEKYICVRMTMPETLFVNGWRGMSPFGTHHVVASLSDEPDGEPDGTTPCDVATVGVQNVFGAGVGSSERKLPLGVAAKLAKGAQLLLNLHLFNATDRVISGRSGVWIRTVAEADVREVSDGVLAGPLKLSVPPGRSTSYGKCTFDRDMTVFGIMPHMHQTGVSMKVVAHTAVKGDVVLFDGPYSFDNQITYPVDMLPIKAGDVVDVACTYENPTDRTLHWGGSSKDEMCNAGLGRFPAGGASVCSM